MSLDLSGLGAVFAEIEHDIREQAKNDLKDLAQKTLEEMRNMARERLGAQAPRYIEALSLGDLPDGFEISLEPDAHDLETGTPAHDMKPALLRGGEISKEGVRYRRIPLKAPKTAVASVLDVEKSEAVAIAKAKTLTRHERRTKSKGGTQKIQPARAHNTEEMGAKLPGKGGSEIRTVTENSPKDSWIYPARPGANIFRDIEPKIESMMGTLAIKIEK